MRGKANVGSEVWSEMRWAEVQSGASGEGEDVIEERDARQEKTKSAEKPGRASAAEVWGGTEPAPRDEETSRGVPGRRARELATRRW